MIKFRRKVKDVGWVDVVRKGNKWQDEETGETFELFRIQVLADAIDRSVRRIKKWEKDGIFPRSLFAPEGEACTHWYTSAQIVNCYRLMNGKYQGKKGLFRQNKDFLYSFLSDVKAIWFNKEVVVSEAGVIGGEHERRPSKPNKGHQNRPQQGSR